MLFDILNIKRIKIAQNEAAIPIKAIILLPSRGFLKSSKLILKRIRPIAKTTNMLVKSFMKNSVSEN
jgi:hypothetical protein